MFLSIKNWEKHLETNKFVIESVKYIEIEYRQKISTTQYLHIYMGTLHQ